MSVVASVGPNLLIDSVCHTIHAHILFVDWMNDASPFRSHGTRSTLTFKYIFKNLFHSRKKENYDWFSRALQEDKQASHFINCMISLDMQINTLCKFKEYEI